MNEQEIRNAVQTVIRQLQTKSTSGDSNKESKQMTLRLAKLLIEKVEKRAKDMGVNAVIAVSDSSARPVAVHCMDDALIVSFDVALNKTFTSAGLKMSTAKLCELSQPGQSLYGIQYTNEGKIVIFGGGEPLEVDGKIIGALGVSGGTAKQDTAIAAYGKDVLKEVIACL